MNTIEKLETEPVFTYQENVLDLAFCKRAFFVQVSRRAAEYKNKFEYSKARADRQAYEDVEKIFQKHFLRRKYSNYNSFRASRHRKL